MKGCVELRIRELVNARVAGLIVSSYMAGGYGDPMRFKKDRLAATEIIDFMRSAIVKEVSETVGLGAQVGTHDAAEGFANRVCDDFVEKVEEYVHGRVYLLDRKFLL
jgi:hypothetical protein